MSTSLHRVLLSCPSRIPLPVTGGDGTPPRSWIQLARTGDYTSTRYGKFSITADDLARMLANFRDVTPLSPTELPIDYDHLSMDPKKPGDGIAAGWMKRLELREHGTELWAEVEWTPDGAARIEKKEYRFVSPSFVKNHTHKDGTKIGATLLAAAITNHPFLEGMQALTLYSFSTMGDLALADGPAERMALAVGGADGTTPGQRVMIAPGHARTHDELGATFEIAEVVGKGDDAFVSVKDAHGLVHKWFRVTELLPASATPANPPRPALVPGAAPLVPVQAVATDPPTTPKGQTPATPKTATPKTEEQEHTMNDSTKKLLALAETYAHTHHCALSHAVIKISTEHPALTAGYGDEVGANVTTRPVEVISLRTDTEAVEEFMALAHTIATERGMALGEAAKEAGRQRPDLGAAWARG